MLNNEQILSALLIKLVTVCIQSMKTIFTNASRIKMLSKQSEVLLNQHRQMARNSKSQITARKNSKTTHSITQTTHYHQQTGLYKRHIEPTNPTLGRPNKAVCVILFTLRT